jgi:hypothetical protein
MIETATQRWIAGFVCLLASGALVFTLVATPGPTWLRLLSTVLLWFLSLATGRHFSLAERMDKERNG